MGRCLKHQLSRNILYFPLPSAGVDGPEPDLRGDPRRLPLDGVVSDGEQRLLLGRRLQGYGRRRLRQVPLLALRVRRHREHDALAGARSGRPRHTGPSRVSTVKCQIEFTPLFFFSFFPFFVFEFCSICLTKRKIHYNIHCLSLLCGVAP